MHLFIFLSIYNPGIFFRVRVAMTQFSFFQAYFLLYTFHPRFAHRFVGYLEEEAVHTYSKCLEAYDNGHLPVWSAMKPPKEAIDYYGLNAETATMRDVILSVRADEACHRCVNHHFSDIPHYYDIEMQEI
jgi:ubiquinol oxidase